MKGDPVMVNIIIVIYRGNGKRGFKYRKYSEKTGA